MEGEGSHGGGRESWRGEGAMEGQMEGKKVVVLASHFVCGQPFLLVSGRLRSWVSFTMAGGAFVRGQGVVSWVLVIRMWGSSSSALSFVVMVVVLGVGLLFMGAVLSFMELVHRRCTSFVADVHGLSYMRGVGAVLGH